VVGRRSSDVAIGSAVCALMLVCVIGQSSVLAHLWYSNLSSDHRPYRRAFLERVDARIPPDARYASNIRAAGYVLYPRPRTRLSFSGSPESTLRRLKRTNVRYVVVSLPLPESLRGVHPWSRVVLRTRSAALLEFAWPTG